MKIVRGFSDNLHSKLLIGITNSVFVEIDLPNASFKIYTSYTYQ